MHLATTAPTRKSAPSVGVGASKNRVWGFFEDGVKRAWKIDPQVVEQHLEKTTAKTTTAPGVPHWPSRDPIGERGGLNLYGMVGNNAVSRVDRLGLCDLAIFESTHPDGASDEPQGSGRDAPSPIEHLGLRPVEDQTPWFDEHYPNLIKEAKKRFRDQIELQIRDTVCGRGANSANVEGYVVLSVWAKNYRIPVGDWSAWKDPTSPIVLDDTFGDIPQSVFSGAASLGKFWFRAAPRTVEVKRGEKCVKNWNGGKICCQAIYYTATMEVRDSIGPVIGFYKATRGSWEVSGRFLCCKKVKGESE